MASDPIKCNDDKAICRLLLPADDLDQGLAVTPYTLSPIGKSVCKESAEIRKRCAIGCDAPCQSGSGSDILAQSELKKWAAKSTVKGQAADASKTTELAVVMLKAIVSGDSPNAFREQRAHAHNWKAQGSGLHSVDEINKLLGHKTKTSGPKKDHRLLPSAARVFKEMKVGHHPSGAPLPPVPIQPKTAISNIESALKHKTVHADDAVISSAAAEEAQAAHKAALDALRSQNTNEADVIAAVQAAVRGKTGGAKNANAAPKPHCSIPIADSPRACGGAALTLEGAWDVRSRQSNSNATESVKALVCEAVPICLQQW